MIGQRQLALIGLIILITSSEALGQYLLRVYHNIKKNSAFKRRYFLFIPTKFLPLITWALYGVCTYLLLHAYEYTTMGKAEVYWDALSALFVPLIGFILFDNKIEFIGWIGISLIIIGTLLLGFERYCCADLFYTE